MRSYRYSSTSTHLAELTRPDWFILVFYGRFGGLCVPRVDGQQPQSVSPLRLYLASSDNTLLSLQSKVEIYDPDNPVWHFHGLPDILCHHVRHPGIDAGR